MSELSARLENAEGSVSGLFLPAVLALAGASLYYYRFRVPVGVSGIMSVMILLAGLLVETIKPGLIEDNLPAFLFLAGVASFTLAMTYDRRDLTRTTINTDKAFWLHLLAAPLIMHSLLALSSNGDMDMQDQGYAFTSIAIFMVLSLVAVVIDRRALLVSGLSYFGIAVGYLISQAEVSSEATMAVTLLVLGGFILVLGTGWRPVRRVVMSPLRDTAVMRFVPAAS